MYHKTREKYARKLSRMHARNYGMKTWEIIKKLSKMCRKNLSKKVFLHKTRRSFKKHAK